TPPPPGTPHDSDLRDPPSLEPPPSLEAIVLTAQRPAPGARARTVHPPVWRHLDVVLVVTVVAIAAFGALMVYSSTRVPLETAGISPTFYLKRQVIFVLAG